ncbi:MAG TPA: UDP-N-acetylglucosamine 1-carboxyvinyltransferase [Gaiellales bacterium]|nr:UDP-N-acetylglucosamine 1-carboxyvinyltransferase [Gaiellales bacterium]
MAIATRADTVESFLIEGGTPLSGTVRPAGNKNAALPILAACLLTADPVTLENVPRIRDVEEMIELIVALGVDVEWLAQNTVRVWASDVASTKLDPELCERIRASILFAGPLLARFGAADVPPPGGDVIGRRRVDTHLMALAALGADIDVGREYRLRAPNGLRGAEVYLDEASVTGTENALMAASLASGETTIVNAACEPHVQDLCRLLTGMGAQVDGIGSNVLTVHGAKELRGCSHRIGADHIEVASFIGLAAVTGGDLVIEDAAVEHLRAIRHTFHRLGVDIECDGDRVHVHPDQPLRIVDDLHDQIPKIEDGPWPMFPADLTSIAVAVATQATGTVLIFEKMFENRLVFTDKLVSMGARIILCDPHRAVITGPAKLYGYRMESPDIRAGMAMLIASLCAEGTSRIGNVGQIDRGYERIDDRLRALGARIERTNG